MSLHMIPYVQWHNPMKAPPCMRWRGLHLAFVVKATRFLGPLSPLGPHRTCDHLKHQLPDAPAAVSRPSRGFPRSSDLSSVAFRLGDVSFSTTAERVPQGVRPTFSRFPSFHSSIRRIRMVIPRAINFLHRLSTSRDEVRPRDGSRCRCSSTQHDLASPEDRHDETGCSRSRVGLPGRQLSRCSWRRRRRSAGRTAPRRSSGRLDRRHADRRGAFLDGGTRDPPSSSTWTPPSGSPDTPSTSPYSGPPGTPTADPMPGRTRVEAARAHSGMSRRLATTQRAPPWRRAASRDTWSGRRAHRRPARATTRPGTRPGAGLDDGIAAAASGFDVSGHRLPQGRRHRDCLAVVAGRPNRRRSCEMVD